MSSAAKKREQTDPMWPPRMRTTSENDPKSMSNFRIPQSAKAILERAEFQGLTQTDAMLTALEFVKDVIDTMGDEWWSVLREAQETTTPTGIIVGKLALEATKRKK